MFNVAIQIANADSIDPFDPSVAVCYFYMSHIYSQQGESENAFKDYLHDTLNLQISLISLAANFGRIIAPSHPCVGIEYTVATDLASELSAELAERYGEDKLNYLSKLDCKNDAERDVVNKQMGKIDQSLSKAFLQDKKLNEALEKVQKALELDPQNEEINGACELIKSEKN